MFVWGLGLLELEMGTGTVMGGWFGRGVLGVEGVWGGLLRRVRVE